MKDCKKGYPEIEGHCCCNCRHQLELMKHPSNNQEYRLKGMISERTGLYACTILGKMDGYRKATIQDSNHGSCEMFEAVTNAQVTSTIKENYGIAWCKCKTPILTENTENDFNVRKQCFNCGLPWHR